MIYKSYFMKKKTKRKNNNLINGRIINKRKIFNKFKI